jgi:ribosomal protein L35
MTKRAITDRFRVTKNGKVIRRPMGLGHSRANKGGESIRNKRKNRPLLNMDSRKIAKKYL